MRERIAATLQAARRLKSYSGAQRYEFDQEQETVAVSDDEYHSAVTMPATAVAWAAERIDEILGTPPTPGV